MNRNYKIGIIAAVIASIMIAVPVYLYWAFGTQESMYRRGFATPFWTTLENDTRDVVIRQGETKTLPVELHYWNGLRGTLLGIKFEEPEVDGGGLYNPPDGLAISFNLDDSYIQVDNGKIIDVSSGRNVKLKVPSEIDQRLEGGGMIVAEVGNITISVSNDVPTGDYNFGMATSDSNVNSQYGGNSQLLAIKVIEQNVQGISCQEHSLCTYQLKVGNETYPINFRMNGTIENMTADTITRTLTIKVKVPSGAALQIALPREVIDGRAGPDGKSGVDEDFAVFADEVNVAADEYSPRDAKWAEALEINEKPEMYRILAIQIAEGTETVEIVATMSA